MSQIAQTSLAHQIDETIRQHGPMSLSTYMRLCLTHPTLGYYRQAHPIGITGDFITAPEVSQMFGEAIGLWLAVLQKELAQDIDVLELGPGRGTLMNDALRSFTKSSGGKKPNELLLLETSPHLKQEQCNKLNSFSPVWIEDLDQIPLEGPPLIIIANEFFDALPIKQYQKADGEWYERVVGLVENKRAWGLAPTPMPKTELPKFLQEATDGAIWEACPAAELVSNTLASIIVQRGGAILAIDYGYDETQIGDTFQALENHAFADPLEHPGQADLTAHVDFEAIATAAKKANAQTNILQTQNTFLTALGIRERTSALAKVNPDRADDFIADLERLIGHKQMGTLFKVLCISSPGCTPYPFVDEATEEIM